MLFWSTSTLNHLNVKITKLRLLFIVRALNSFFSLKKLQEWTAKKLDGNLNPGDKIFKIDWHELKIRLYEGHLAWTVMLWKFEINVGSSKKSISKWRF